MMNKEYWLDDEFEINLTKGLMAIYDDNFSNKYQKKNDICPYLIMNNADLRFVKQIGPYFAPHDRIIIANEIDTINDGLPKYASGAFDPPKEPSRDDNGKLHHISGYLNMLFCRKMEILDPHFKRTGYGVPYVIYIYYPLDQGGSVQYRAWVTIDDMGKIYPCYERLFGPGGKIRKNPVFGGIDQNVLMAAATIGLFSDRKFLWNVVAKEDIAKVTFGIYEEQIKSLFYARELPLTETGRKRPILHWVKAHRKRMKKGYEINIEKYLRGTNNFIMHGTEFSISRPCKKVSD